MTPEQANDIVSEVAGLISDARFELRKLSAFSERVSIEAEDLECRLMAVESKVMKLDVECPAENDGQLGLFGDEDLR